MVARQMRGETTARGDNHMTNEVLDVKEVASKMLAVCKSLGWKADKPSDGFSHVYLKAQIDGFPSSYVSLTYGRYPYEGRITVTAYSNHDSSIYRYGENHLSISVSATRPADQIVKEIQRRFLPTVSGDRPQSGGDSTPPRRIPPATGSLYGRFEGGTSG